MASVAKITLLGRLGKDAVLNTGTNGGKPYAKFSIATEQYDGKDDSGKAKYSTQWWDCVVFGQQAEYVGNNAKKGHDVYVEGNLKLNAKGDKAYTDVTVNQFVLISRPGGQAAAGEAASAPSTSAPSTSNGSSSSNGSSRGAAAAQRAAATTPSAAASAAAVADLGDDDLPF